VSEPEKSAGAAEVERRTFLTTASGWAMAGGLVGGYGTLAAMAGRFLYSGQATEVRAVYVTDGARIQPGDSFRYVSPAGHEITITRVGNAGDVSDFIALSSVCPHLGCRVHWEAPHQRFFCPCHNGTFDPVGVATGGPPMEAGQSLARYELHLNEANLLFIKLPETMLVPLSPTQGRTENQRPGTPAETDTEVA
jgi:cytochrome b6-f complex iron-sulfur subunit